MKKIVIAAIFILSVTAGHAQKLRLGVCLNPHLDWFSENADLTKSNGSRIGIEGGLVVENYFAKNYAFLTGIRLGTYGGRMIYNDSITFITDEKDKKVPPGLDVKYRLQYISVPLALKLKTNQMGYMSFFAQLGFTPQINIGAKADAPPALNNDGASKEVGLFALSYHFGAGLEYGVGGNTAIVIAVLYNNGFLDILTKQPGKESLNYLTLHAGVMF